MSATRRGWLRPLTAVLGAIVMVASAGALVWRERRDPHRAGLLVALALVSAGLVNLVLWWVVGAFVAPPLERATGSGPGTWNLPAGLRALLGDVRDAVAADVGDTVRRYGGVLLATGCGPRRRHRRRAAAARRGDPRPPLAVAGAVAAAVAVVATIGAANVGTAAPRACNGHVELCDRPLRRGRLRGDPQLDVEPGRRAGLAGARR